MNNTNTSKSNTINQSMFINDILLSILSKQLNDLNLLNDLSNTKTDDDLLVIDDFTDQQSQFTDLLPR